MMNFRSVRRWFLQKRDLTVVVLCCMTTATLTADPAGGASPNMTDVHYLDGTTTDEYAKKMCTLDVYLPPNKKNFPLLVWFHGGQLTTGDKSEHPNLARAVANEGIGVVLPNYRLSPTVKYPVYLEDSAQAVAWAKAHASELGADPKQLFIGGYSAGAYVAAMLVMNEDLLRKVGIEPQSLAGVICMSGMMVTPISVRAERGIGANTIVSDEGAPLYHTREQTPPLFLFVGDHDKPARKEENEYFAASLKAAGDTNVEFEVFAQRDHKTIAGLVFTEGDPVWPAIKRFLEAHSKVNQWIDELQNE